MANITTEHLHHMARRHHATMQKLDTLRAQITSYAHKSFGLLETGAGAWAGGLIEGKYGGAALGPLPYNLLAGVGFLVAAHMNLAKDYSKHLENVGNGLVASYTSALGYSFGKRWRETGKAFGGGGSPWMHPYENGWPKNLAAAAAAPTAAGQWPTTDPTPAQMAAIAQQMQAAANAPAY